MNEHIENVRRRIGELASLDAQTDAAERKILERAEKRLEAVQARMDELHPRAVVDNAAGTEYLTLAKERHQLNVIIETAKRNLS